MGCLSKKMGPNTKGVLAQDLKVKVELPLWVGGRRGGSWKILSRDESSFPFQGLQVYRHTVPRMETYKNNIVRKKSSLSSGLCS